MQATNLFPQSIIVRDFGSTNGINATLSTNLGVAGSSLGGNSAGDFWSSASRYQPFFGAGTNEIRLLGYGINDIQYGIVRDSGGPEPWFENLTNAVYACHTNGIWRLAVATVFYSIADTEQMEFYRKSINGKIRDWVLDGSDGMDVILVDWDAWMGVPATAYRQDNTHENDLGAAVMWSAYNAVLNAAFSVRTNYVDASVVGGANDGSSWANAWRSFTNVDYTLSKVSANTIVEISGGDYLTTNELGNLAPYDGFKLCGGTDATNFIVYRSSTASGHDGQVTFHRTINLSPFTQLIGHKTNGIESVIGDNTYAVPLITNNCNIVFDLRDVETRDAAWHSAFKVIEGGQVVVRWVRSIGIFAPTTGTITSASMEDRTKNFWSSGVDLYVASSPTATCEADIGYCWFDQFHQAFNLTGGSSSGYGTVRIHHTLAEHHHVGIFDEGFGPGIDYDHNIFRKRLGDYRHSEADGFQCNGGALHHCRIHHNIIESPDNSLGDWVVDADSYNLFFYANIIKPTDWASLPIYDYNTGGSPLMIRAQSDGVTFSNVCFLNNTLVAGPSPYGIVTALMQFQNDAHIKRVATNGVLVMDNLFMHGGAGETVSLGFSNWWYDAKAVIYDFNQSYTADSTHGVLRWLTATNGSSLLLTNAAEIASRVGFSNNVTEVAVTLHNEAAEDYRPETSAVNIGTNLLWSLTNVTYLGAFNELPLASDMPGLTVDIYGKARSASGTWSAGAVEYSAITDTSAPVIVEDVPDRTQPLGTEVSLSILATGAPPLAFYWKKGGAVITNSAWPFLLIGPSTSDDVGNYSVIVSNAYGTTTSRTATYTISGTTNLTNGLVLWLTFDRSDNWTNGGYIPDHSGRTNHAYIFDPPEFSEAYAGHYTSNTNYLNEVDPSNGYWYIDALGRSLNAHRSPIPTNGPGGLNAAQFTVVYRGTTTVDAVNVHSFGTFAGVTNQDPDWMTMTNATWAVWAWHQPAPWGGYPQQTAIIGNGYYADHGWSFREASGETIPAINISTNAPNEDPHITAVAFPDVSVITNTWMHYAVTWDGSNWIGYSNSVPFVTNVLNGYTYITATNSQATDNWLYNWMPIGHQSHSGLPDQVMATDFPNNGAFIGQMSDLRLYNRALSAAEVQAIYLLGAESQPAVVARPMSPRMRQMMGGF